VLIERFIKRENIVKRMRISRRAGDYTGLVGGLLLAAGCSGIFYNQGQRTEIVYDQGLTANRSEVNRRWTGIDSAHKACEDLSEDEILEAFSQVIGEVEKGIPIRNDATPEEVMESASRSYEDVLSKYGNEGLAKRLIQIGSMKEDLTLDYRDSCRVDSSYAK